MKFFKNSRKPNELEAFLFSLMTIVLIFSSFAFPAKSGDALPLIMTWGAVVCAAASVRLGGIQFPYLEIVFFLDLVFIAVAWWILGPNDINVAIVCNAGIAILVFIIGWSIIVYFQKQYKEILGNNS